MLIWLVVFTQSHADDSRVEWEMRLAASVILWFSLCVCLSYNKTKTAETKVTKLCTWIVHYDVSPTN